MVDVFGLEAETDEAAGEVLEAGDAGEDAQGQRRSHRALVTQGFVGDAVCDDLHALGAAYDADAVLLNPAEMMVRERVGAERIGEEIGGGDCILQRDVDADAADGGHGVRSVADAEQAGKPPTVKVIDLYGEQLDLVPGIELGGAAGEEGCELFDTGAESFEAVPLNLREEAFGDDVAALEIVVAIDEDECAAVVDVAERVLGVVGMAGRLNQRTSMGTPCSMRVRCAASREMA